MSFSSGIRRGALFAVAVFIVAGCGGTSTVSGKVSDQAGSQQQGLSSAGEFGGSGTVSTTKTVQAAALSSDGSVQVIAQAQVDASGRYELAIPSGEHRLIL